MISENNNPHNTNNIAFIQLDTVCKIIRVYRENQIQALQILENAFEKYYPRKRQNTITFTDIIKAMNKNDYMSIKEVSARLNRKSTVIGEYLHKLEKWKVLKSKKKGLKKVYKLNSNLPTIRRDYG